MTRPTQGWDGGPYTFRLTFDLTGFDPNTATISGAWGVDNTGEILLNGVAPVGAGEFSLPSYDSGNFDHFHDFTITGGFIAGVNTLDFQVTNAGGPGGLNVNSAGTLGAVPEPSSVVMLGLGSLGLIGLMKRSRRTPKAAANR